MGIDDAAPVSEPEILLGHDGDHRGLSCSRLPNDVEVAETIGVFDVNILSLPAIDRRPELDALGIGSVRNILRFRNDLEILPFDRGHLVIEDARKMEESGEFQ